MNIESLANYAEVIGGATVIVSLIYVGIQIRHNAKSSQSQTNQCAHESLANVSMELALDENLANLTGRGFTAFDQLTSDEQFRFILLMITVFRRHENIYYQYHKGLLEAELWKGYKQSLLLYFYTTGGQEFWKLRRLHFFKLFQNLLELTSRSDVKTELGV